MNNKIEIFQTLNGEIEFKGDFDNETIWASLEQIAKLFNRDKSGISRHIKNIFKNNELVKDSVVAIFATTANDGKVYQVEYYNLDMILSIGYRVDSKEATNFRKWATKVLKQYITNGYAINSDKITNQRFKELESDVTVLKNEMTNIKSKIKDDTKLSQDVFYNGQIWEAYELKNTIFKSSKNNIMIIDNYIDDTVLTICSKYQKLNFIIITEQLGASLKDLGKKIFAFSFIDIEMLKFGKDEK
jgi:hypothetical protein